MWPLPPNQLRLNELTNFSKSILVQANGGLKKKREASVWGNLEIGRRVEPLGCYLGELVKKNQKNKKHLSVFLLGMESYSSLLTSDAENEKKDREGFITSAPFLLALSHPAKYKPRLVLNTRLRNTNLTTCSYQDRQGDFVLFFFFGYTVGSPISNF